MEREHLQESEYAFPYHHIPEMQPFAAFRVLPWAHEYVAYTNAILDELAREPFTSLIDVGCGDGKLLTEAANRFDARLVGTDFSERALRFARAFAPTAEFYTDFPEGQVFDAFTLIEVLEHVPPNEVAAFLSSIAKRLAPGAKGIITVPSVVDTLNPKHYRHFTQELLTETLAPHFTVESVRHLTARGFFPSLVRRLFSNQFFILLHAPLRAMLYRAYVRHCLWSDANHGARLMAVVRKPAS